MALLVCCCILLSALVLILIGKLISLHRAAKEISVLYREKIKEETNVGISISIGDKAMRQLAAELDSSLKLLRKEQLRYIRGDMELKRAVTGISHDLRTPLTAICGYMELLKQEELTENAREYLSVIENRVETMRELTEELFRYSIVLSKEECGAKEPVSLNRALEECGAAYYGALKAAGIEPEIKMPQQEIYRNVNAQALARIFGNIVGNAIKYSDGDLKITLQEDGALVFENSASGLDEILAGHLFDRYFTVASAENSTGLGLSIARKLTEEMQGELEAELKEGVFRVILRF